MACHLFDAEPLSEKEKNGPLGPHFSPNTTNMISENAFENVLCIKVPIQFQPDVIIIVAAFGGPSSYQFHVNRWFNMRVKATNFNNL